MKDWVLSLDGDKWSVKFVRDLGEERGEGVIWILPFGVGLLPLLLGFVWSFLVWFYYLFFLLTFNGRVRVVRSMYLPAALHGIEASLLASDGLRKLRSSVCGAVWSRRQPLANVGAVLSLLDGPTGCDPCFCVVWFRFRLLCRYMALIVFW